MRTVLLIVVIILLAAMVALGGVLVWLYSHSAPPPPPEVQQREPMSTEPNATVYVHQSAINDMLAAIFPIEGAGQIAKGPLSVPYSWRIENPHVEIGPGGPVFSAKARLHVLGKTHEIAAQGNAQVRYDSAAQELFLDLREIQAHTDAKVLGIPLDRLNLGAGLAPEGMHVRLLRNLPLFTHFKVKKPKEVREDVQFSIVGHRIRYEKQQAIVDLTVKFKELSQKVESAAEQAQSK